MEIEKFDWYWWGGYKLSLPLSEFVEWLDRHRILDNIIKKARDRAFANRPDITFLSNENEARYEFEKGLFIMYVFHLATVRGSVFEKLNSLYYYNEGFVKRLLPCAMYKALRGLLDSCKICVSQGGGGGEIYI